MVAPVVAAGIMGAGNLVGRLGGASAARKQNNILAQGQREQSRAGMESTAATGDFLSELRASAANPAAEQGAFAGAVGGNPSISGPMTAGPRFRADARAATVDARGYGSNQARLLARTRAPGLQRQRENEQMMELGNTLRPIQMRAEDDAFMTQLRAGMTQPNPWLQMAGEGLSGTGSYLLGKG